MSSNHKKNPALGRGLGALLKSTDTDITSSSSKPVGSISVISINEIEANPFNPRSSFEKEALEQLSSSIKEHGIIQPLTVRKMGRDNYQLISGERRFKAAQIAGLEDVPCYIRIANDQSMLEMALVENIQRENLNAIEIALSYQRLISECDLTQEQLSGRISKSRSDISNHLRLLKLTPDIQAAVRDRKISMGHARAIVSLSNEEEQLALLNRILNEELSVRATENFTKLKKSKTNKTINVSSEITANAHFLSDKYQTRVKISNNEKGRGNVVIHFSSEEEYHRIMNMLMQK